MALLSTTTLSLAVNDPGLQAASATGDKFAHAAGILFVARNTDVAARTLTFKSTVTAMPGYAPVDLVVSVPAGGVPRMVPFTRARGFIDGNGHISVTYDAITGLTVAAVK